MNRKQKPKTKKSIEEKGIVRVTYIFLGLFVCLIGYIVYFMVCKSEDTINNSYNKRLDSFADYVVRGDIKTSDGEVLAHTEVDNSGNETRVYPYDNVYAHVVGYASKGKTGLELQGNFYMLNSNDNIFVQTYNDITGQKSQGDNVVTTLDSTLQQVAYDALGSNNGAVVVMEPDTGKILAMVSKPDYNPNTLASDWDAIISDTTNSCLVNRATQGLYPPGSTFKILTALEYMREHPDYANFTYDCDGTLLIDEYKIDCYNGNAHGSVDFATAFAKSCNGAFATMGTMLNAGSFNKLCSDMLFNVDLPVSFEHNKSSFSFNTGAGTFDTMQTAIGQGKTQITPLHNAIIASIIANDGVLMKPYLIDHIENCNGVTVKTFKQSEYGKIISDNEANELTTLMRGVVTEGTGQILSYGDYEAAGKTGTAQYDSSENDHSLFTGFAPASDPKIVVSVVVEGEGSDGTKGVAVAKAIFDAYFSR